MPSIPERLRGPILGVAAIIGAVTMIWLDAHRGPEHSGEKLPPFTLHTLDGPAVELDQLSGQPVVIDFWATWCEPCRRSLPGLDRTALAHAGKALVFAVNAEDEPVEAQRRARGELGLRLPMLVDGAKASDLLHVDVLPTTMVIDADGRIAASFSGAGHEDDIDAALKRLE